MDERRKTQRLRVGIDIGIYDLATGERVGKLVNISTEGIMLAGGQLMRVNHVYEFRIVLPVSIYGRNEIVFNAICLWCNKSQESPGFQAGFQMRDATPDLKELITFWIQNPIT